MKHYVHRAPWMQQQVAAEPDDYANRHLILRHSGLVRSLLHDFSLWGLCYSENLYYLCSVSKKLCSEKRGCPVLTAGRV